MRGRRPKPTLVKERAGNPGKRALPKNEPKPAASTKRPRWLTVGGRKVWDEYAARLQGLGLLSEIDETFAHWCELAAQFRADPAGMSANRIARLDAMSQRFGMDPASRSRIAVKPQETGSDEARFFGTG